MIFEQDKYYKCMKQLERFVNYFYIIWAIIGAIIGYLVTGGNGWRIFIWHSNRNIDCKALYSRNENKNTGNAMENGHIQQNNKIIIILWKWLKILFIPSQLHPVRCCINKKIKFYNSSLTTSL